MNAPHTPDPQWVRARTDSVLQAVSQVYVGEAAVPRLLMVALLAGGHALLEGVPGVAKTTLARTFATALGCGFRRVQFTPDLLPSDITGTNVLDPRTGAFSMRPGPLFAHVVLADEINRAPAKTQSALLEAMQERQVTIEGDTHVLPDPFLVLATQNPSEQAGTYPLPEAQIDRFLVRILIDYPDVNTEVAILRRFLGTPPSVSASLTPEELLAMRAAVRSVHVEEEILAYIVRLCRDSREHGHAYLGASPRAGLMLVAASRAAALLDGRGHVLPDDVRALAEPVLAHRIVVTAEAEMDGIDGGQIVRELLRKVPHRSARRG